jgi:hypothetical protein
MMSFLKRLVWPAIKAEIATWLQERALHAPPITAQAIARSANIDMDTFRKVEAGLQVWALQELDRIKL